MFRVLSDIVESMAGDGEDVVRYEPTCVVPDDPGQVVRHAAPLDERARHQLLEQHIARLVAGGPRGLAGSRPAALGGNTRKALLRLRGQDRRAFQ